MADTLPNIVVPKGAWLDIYDASGIAVGTQLEVQNVGSNEAFLNEGASAPSALNAYRVLRTYQTGRNSQSASGAWVYSVLGTVLNVSIAI